MLNFWTPPSIVARSPGSIIRCRSSSSATSSRPLPPFADAPSRDRDVSTCADPARSGADDDDESGDDSALPTTRSRHDGGHPPGPPRPRGSVGIADGDGVAGFVDGRRPAELPTGGVGHAREGLLVPPSWLVVAPSSFPTTPPAKFLYIS